MNLRHCVLLLFCFSFIYKGFSQETPIRDYKNLSNSKTWAYLQTMKVLDSLDKANPITYWSEQNKFSADINEVTYTNWSAGGSNSIAFLFNVDIKRTYERKNIRWQNEFIALYGLHAEKGRKLRKTDDQLELNSTFGYRTSEFSGWFYSAKVNLKSQFDRGYNYPDRENEISSFMAPGYLYSGIGAEYGRDSDKFTLYISPSTVKTTFVYNQRLANEGAFGVTPAVYDLNGNVIRKGRTSKTEFGILVTNEYNAKVAENIEFSNRLSLYTDYLNDFGNIDVDWKIEFNFKVNSFVAAKIISHLKYDNNTKTKETDDFGEEVIRGAKVQWKQQLGIGLVIDI